MLRGPTVPPVGGITGPARPCCALFSSETCACSVAVATQEACNAYVCARTDSMTGESAIAHEASLPVSSAACVGYAVHRRLRLCAPMLLASASRGAA